MDRVGDVLAQMDALPETDRASSLRGILELPPARAALELPDNLVPSLAAHLLERIASLGWGWYPESTRGRVERRVLSALAARPRRLESQDLELLAGLATRVEPVWRAPDILDLPLAALEARAAEGPIGALEEPARRLLANVESSDSRLSPGARARLLSRLRSVLADRDVVDIDVFDATDGWGTAMRSWVATESTRVASTNAMLRHLRMATTVNPTATWQGTCASLVANDDPERLVRAMLDTALAHTGRIGRPTWEERSDALVAGNAALVRGAIWAAELLRPSWLTDLTGRLGLHYGMSPSDNNFARDEKVAASCAALLGRLDDPDAAVALGRMRAQVRSRAVLKQVDRAIQEISRRTDTPIWQLLESAVPTFGLDTDGRRTLAFGGASVEISLDEDGRVRLTWHAADGAVSAKPPPAVGDARSARVTALKAEAKEIEKAAASERARLEELLIAPRSWPASLWQSRYLGHPLTRPWAARMLWIFEDAGSRQVGMPVQDGFDGLDGPISLGPDTIVRPWHPISANGSDVEGWRDRLFEKQIRQPFKQAFREIYRLTASERQRSSSGRFAGFVLHYRQASALMSARRWNANRLGFWDGGFDGVAKRSFESHGIRAEFDHQLARDEGSIAAEVDERRERAARAGPGPATMDELVARLVEAARRHLEQPADPESVRFEDVRYCRTGEVRFFRADDVQSAEPLHLRDVQPEVFSEAMRDLDLFVSVASVAVDQLWRDLDEPRISRYRDLSAYAVLPESAQVRRDVLHRLIPRSRIADRCSFEDRFLRVRGDRRTYRIHLGSGQVLMEPNDEHLVMPIPGRSGPVHGHFLPFDDTLLGHVLTRAFILADDAKIRDVELRRQIESG